MPIVHIRGNAQTGTEAALGAIAEEVAKAVDCATGDIWCTYDQVATTVGKQLHNVLYVDLLARPRERDLLQKGLEAAAKAASRSFGVRLEDVWAHLTVLEPATVFAGRRLL